MKRLQRVVFFETSNLFYVSIFTFHLTFLNTYRKVVMSLANVSFVMTLLSYSLPLTNRR